MEAGRTASVGIMPVGALGVAFHHHLAAGPKGLSRVAFMSRSSARPERWKAGAFVAVESLAGRIDLALEGRWLGSLREAARAEALPDIVLVCTNPDQLFEVIADYVAVVESEHRAGRLLTGHARLPALVLCANGIYFQRLRRSFIELLEEATLLGRIPDLWPVLMPQIVGRLIRGVTIQTSVRRGEGTEAVYRPGPKGRTQLTGGDPITRAWVTGQLAQTGCLFEDAGEVLPTRVEFNKAMVNLASNVLGILAAIDADGRMTRLTVSEIGERVSRERIRELVERVIQVGRGVNVYRPDESVDLIFDETMAWLASAKTHVPSSLQWLEQQRAVGSLAGGLSPTEKWLLQPLQHYARSLGEPGAMEYFEGLERGVAGAIDRAVSKSKG